MAVEDSCGFVSGCAIAPCPRVSDSNRVESQVPGIDRGGIRQGVRSPMTALWKVGNLCVAATKETFWGLPQTITPGACRR